jgi:hypothetical protein
MGATPGASMAARASPAPFAAATARQLPQYVPVSAFAPVAAVAGGGARPSTATTAAGFPSRTAPVGVTATPGGGSLKPGALFGAR